MRLSRRKPDAAWITDTTPVLKPSDLRTVLMIFGVWIGFAAAIHYADSPSLFAAVEFVNHALNPLNRGETPAPVDNEALIVAADHNTELTTVATLSPRGYHPVIAAGAQDALARVHAADRLWKLVVIDASLPGAATLTRALHEELPAASIVAVQGHRGPLAVSGMLLDRLNAPQQETVAN